VWEKDNKLILALGQEQQQPSGTNKLIKHMDRTSENVTCEAVDGAR